MKQYRPLIHEIMYDLAVVEQNTGAKIIVEVEQAVA
jgi:hypothetical protein